MSKEEALDVIAEEFVNYNRLPGRGRDFLESMGLMWFYNYKLRIMKIAVKMVRERPATALFYASGVAPLMNIDTVFSGSLAGNLYDGSYEYSLGPEMGPRELLPVSIDTRAGARQRIELRVRA